MITILQKENKKLRAVAQLIPLKEITTPKIQKIIADMKMAMHGEDDAVAIAAPQIGVLLRIFIVSGKIFLSKKERHEESQVEKLPPDLIFINPELVKRSRKEKWVEEGCLSVRWLYGKVKRAEKATVRAYDERGNLFTRGAGGILAQVFQHEIEHLNGKLFTDKARDIQEIPPLEIKKSDK